jgi:hypothetical protein
MAEGVCQFKDLTLVFENSAACSLNVYTDMPGGVVQARRSLTLPVTTTRTEKTFPFDDQNQGLVDGKLIKFKAAPAGVLKLYSGFVRFRRIGEYIDGTVGEIWETQEISLSP